MVFEKSLGSAPPPSGFPDNCSLRLGTRTYLCRSGMLGLLLVAGTGGYLVTRRRRARFVA